MLELSQVFFGLVRCCLSDILLGICCRQATLYKSLTKEKECRDLAIALALIYILQADYVVVKLFLKIIGTFCNNIFIW